ncbi:MAG TPA: hypothetical protein PLP29_04215 [Candidatus Ozemobacteraceae bacterium]|nr:hypothetical protein [Candidatus Ozemobacteraceae bacterium]
MAGRHAITVRRFPWLGILGLAALLAFPGMARAAPGSPLPAPSPIFCAGELAILKTRPAAVLGAWITVPGVAEPLLVTVIPIPEREAFSACLYLPLEGEPALSQAIHARLPQPFRGYTAGGGLFYERGFCRTGRLRDEDSGLEIAFTHVPHEVAGRDNPAFAGDIGLLQLEASMTTLLTAPDALLRPAFNRPVQACAAPAGELYPLMDTHFGVPHRLVADGFAAPVEACLLPPVHKLSANKHLGTREEKSEADLSDLAALLASDSGLLSQRERLRRRRVPDTVKLNWSRIDDTDIGSGQNQFVFLALGPGINYFDGPWRRREVVLPGPRVILDPAVVNLADAQIYPSYSIDPPDRGEGRLAAINRFQTGANTACREAVPMPARRRGRVIRELAGALCRYGLLNDDPTLEKGFTFLGSAFQGNIINNEIRLRDALSLREWAIGVIVPPGTADRARHLLADIGFSPENGPGGIPLPDFVIEAPFATDEGFRMAYLEFVLCRSNTVLARLVRLLRPSGASGSGIRPGYLPTLKAIDRLIRREGLAFLLQPRAFDAARRWGVWRRAWSAWRTAALNGAPEAERRRLRCRADMLYRTLSE